MTYLQGSTEAPMESRDVPMTTGVEARSGAGTGILSADLLPRWILFALLVAGLSLRAYEIGAPAMDFQPTRQYRSALLARHLYYQYTAGEATPAWKREVALANVREEGVLEPPVLEALAAIGYRIAGGERLWIPRLLSSCFWLLGALFLFRISRRLGSVESALAATAFYLFLPFGISASRAFMPDPLMVALLLASLLAVLRFQEERTTSRLLVAASSAALAILVKPVCLFLILAAFLAGEAARRGPRRAVSGRAFLTFAGVALAPGLAYYLAGVLGGGFLRSQAASSFVPQLWLQSEYWQFWLKHIHATVGFAPLMGGLAGVLLLPAGPGRGFLLGLWAGYLAFGLTFTYHIHTHDYYQLQLIPVVALSLGPLAADVAQRIVETGRAPARRLAVGGLFLLAVGLGTGLHLRRLQELPDTAGLIARAEEVGAAVSHSTRTLILDRNSQALRYYGRFAGWYWPDRGEIRANTRWWGEPPMDARARFRSLAEELSPEYFVVTDFSEFEAQEDLKNLLTTRYPVSAAGQGYLVFDLSSGVP